MTESQFIKQVTLNFLQSIDPSKHHLIKNDYVVREQFISDLHTETKNAIALEKSDKTKQSNFQISKNLTKAQIAICLRFLYTVIRISYDTDNYENDDTALLAIYIDDTSKSDYGLYSTSTTYINKLITNFNDSLTDKEVEDIKSILSNLVSIYPRKEDKNLIPLNNGIFNYQTKEFFQYSRDYIFTEKITVNFNPNANKPPIYNDYGNESWDIENWFTTLSDDPQVVNTLWQCLGAVIRPGVRWNKMLFLLNPKGNNGKGTYCELARQLCGPKNYVTIPLNQFGGEFGLEPLINKTAVITDENPTEVFVSNAINLKSAVTGDVLTINRKNKTIINYRFNGFMIQCLNGIPRSSDTSGSFYRRQIYIPMVKEFEGKEKKWIKDDYIKRRDTLEYIVYKLLVCTNYYEIDVPVAAKNLLNEVKVVNDSTREFFNEIEPLLQWKNVPIPFIYDIYLKWNAKNNPSGKTLGKTNFTKQLESITSDKDVIYEKMIDNKLHYYKWEVTPSDVQKRITKSEIETPEPLISEFDLKDWSIASQTSSSSMKNIAYFSREKYRMLIRKDLTNEQPNL